MTLEEPEVVYYAIDLYNKKNIDFVDCYLIAKHKIYNDEILTFDKKMNKILEE